uniref:CCHC-type domain-containing protein n=1 Tax=Schistosoma mansoni TaxID=6183 RepID=A0AA82N838_SCHMA
MERLDLNSDFNAFEEYMERFEIWAMTKEDDEDFNIVAHFLTFIGKEAYSLIKTLALPDKPISLPYETLKQLLLDHVKYTNSECGKREKSDKMTRQNIRNSITLPSRRSSMRNKSYPDNTSLIFETVHEDEHEISKCLFCGKFYPCNSCIFRNSECFKCGITGHIQSLCNTMVHFAETNAKMDVSNDHLSLSRSGITSHNSSELNETQNHCATKIFSQQTYQISHVIVPDMVCRNNSHTSDGISYNSENRMLNESNHDQRPNSVLVDAEFSDDPLFSNETLNQFEENISEESNYDIISSVSGPHNQFISYDIPNECEKYVQNESNCSHISDVIVSDIGYSHEQCMLNRIPSQGYNESEGIAKFTEIIGELVFPEVKFAQTANPNQVQDYPNEYEADECFLFDCFAGKSSLVESHVLITYINAYLSVYSNMNNKKNMYHDFYSSQSHMMEYLKLYISVYPQILTYSSRCVRFEKIMQIGNVILAKTLRRKDPTLFRGGGYCWKVYDANSKHQWFHYTTDMLIVYNSRTQVSLFQFSLLILILMSAF